MMVLHVVDVMASCARGDSQLTPKHILNCMPSQHVKLLERKIHLACKHRYCTESTSWQLHQIKEQYNMQPHTCSPHIPLRKALGMCFAVETW